MIAFSTTVNHNYYVTLEPMEVNFCFLGLLPRWLTVAKHKTINWAKFVCYILKGAENQQLQVKFPY